MASFVVLLRAINVGGTGKLPMSDLKQMCEVLGFGGVRTYVASGNVVFISHKSEAAVKAALEERLEAAVTGGPGQDEIRVVRVERRATGPGVAVHDGEADLVFVGVEVQEELLDLMDDLADPRVAPVHLVDDQDHGKSRLERFAKHEAGLGQRTLGGIDEQQDAIDHRQRAFDLAAEVGVAWRVDDVDLDSRIADGGVLGQDRDALLTLQVHRVHDPIGEFLMGAEGSGLAEHGVDEGGLAVVDVGDNRHVANISARGHTDFRTRVGTSRVPLGAGDSGARDPGPSGIAGNRRSRGWEAFLSTLTRRSSVGSRPRRVHGRNRRRWVRPWTLVLERQVPRHLPRQWFAPVPRPGLRPPTR